MTIRLKLMKNTAQISFPSLRFIFSDKLLGKAWSSPIILSLLKLPLFSYA